LKLLLKDVVVPILASRPITAFAIRFFGYGIPIFVLHRIEYKDHPAAGRINADHLRRCLQYLVDNGHTFLSLEDIILALESKRPLPPKAVAFTMDDGFLDQAEVAAPIFLEFDCPLTFFVITGMLDQAMWPWDAQVSWIIETTQKTSMEINVAGKILSLKLEDAYSRRLAKRSIQDTIREMGAEQVPDILQQLSDDAGVLIPENPPPQYQSMTWEMARRLESTGIRFAPHTITHNIVSKLTDECVEKEIQGSWLSLKKELTNPLKVFCYPRGGTTDFGTREIEILKKNQFLGATSTTPECVKLGKDPQRQIFNLPRLALPGSMTDFIQYSTWIEYAKNIHRKSVSSK
jgi:peptidoglycan/xylan/chitin deacetylase (PgdA/CDA1 family)